jgi:Ni2+-binding GTPase involved in maturation of urease and hydrogenase
MDYKMHALEISKYASTIKEHVSNAKKSRVNNVNAGKKCHNCGKMGHIRKDCRSRIKEETDVNSDMWMVNSVSNGNQLTKNYSQYINVMEYIMSKRT